MAKRFVLGFKIKVLGVKYIVCPSAFQQNDKAQRDFINCTEEVMHNGKIKGQAQISV